MRLAPPVPRWRPAPGDGVAGFLVVVRDVPDPWRPGTLARVATLATDSGAVDVWLGPRHLRASWARWRPRPGDWVALRFLGPARELSPAGARRERERRADEPPTRAPHRYFMSVTRREDHDGYRELCEPPPIIFGKGGVPGARALAPAESNGGPHSPASG